ncbi:transmembrane protein 248 [Rhincodon typus]|uniref:transmembrane protein 248 n=1 Tax=Rhincodon typus TaxID=259920 RepID=UPI0009A34483|nr:transmembrane protein 248 [Rhincodon typus]
MVSWHLLENVKYFVLHRPPMILFILSISSLGIAFFSLGIYIQSHEVSNPDVPQTWNAVLQSLSKLEFCRPENESLWQTSTEPLPFGRGSVRRRPDPDPLAHTTTRQSVTTIAFTRDTSESVSLLLPITYNSKEPLKRFSSDITRLHAVVNGNLLGLEDSKAKEVINIMLISPWPPEHYLSQINSTNNMSTLTCITMSASAHVLPQARYFPSCNLENFTDALLYQNTLAKNSEKTPSQGHTSAQCYKAQYKPEPKFTIVLSKEDRILCSQHLLKSSYILLLLALVVFCLRVACGRRKKKRHKTMNLHKAHLLEM